MLGSERLRGSKIMASSFDLSQVLAQANQVSEESSNGGGSNEKLIYPQDGKLNIRILFNPKSQVVIRKFERHTVNGTKVPCLASYGTDCPVCKVLGDIKNAKGVDLWQFARKSRGICYAEYVSSDYKWEKPEYEPKSGEIIMLMFPWTVYQDLNRLISSAGENLASLVASNTGFVISIEKYTENKQVKYKTAIDPFNTSHQTRPTDQEYNDLLMSLDSLNDKFVPSVISDDIVAKAKEVAEQLSREYLNPVQATQPNLGQPGANLGGMMGQPSMGVPQTPPPQQDAQGNWYDFINGQWVMRQTQAQPQNFGAFNAQMSATGMPNQMSASTANPTMSTNQPMNNQFSGMNPPMNQTAQPDLAGKPQCFGRHGDPSIDANTCLLCPNEAECQARPPFN